MDIFDIWHVIHFGVPVEVDQYLRETGRAGLDGNLSSAVVIRHDDTFVGGKISEHMKLMQKQVAADSQCFSMPLVQKQNPLPAAIFFVVTIAPLVFHVVLVRKDCYACSHSQQSCNCVKLCHLLTTNEHSIIPKSAEQRTVRHPFRSVGRISL